MAVTLPDPYVIAEAAIQHYGRVASAKSIVRRANRIGADAVKFQMFLPGEDLFCPLEGDDKRWRRWETSFMTPKQWGEVKQCCDAIGIDFLASAFQHSAVKVLRDLNVRAYKVGSRAAETYPYEDAPGPFLISTGMYWPEPLSSAYVYLQCKSEYPHEPYRWIDDEGYHGLSDHSGSPWPSIHALARGASVIEVHVKFYSNKSDPDHTSSISLSELRLICDARDNFAALRQD